MKYDAVKLKTARVRKRMTGLELAGETGLAPSTISRIENGKTDGKAWIKAIRKMERVLGVSDVIKTNGR